MVATIKDRLQHWIDDSITAIGTHLQINTNFGGIPKDMRVEFFEDDSSSAPGATMGTNDGGSSLMLRLNLSKISQAANQSDDGWGQIDALVAHEIVHAYQFTKMPKSLTGEIDTWFLEGMATAMQGGMPFLNQLANNSDATITGSWTGDYGSAYAAALVLHEITDGGLNAIIDRLEAGDTLNQAFANTMQNNLGTGGTP